MTSNHHVPYVLGYTRTTMGVTERSEAARQSKSDKSIPSSDCRLQLSNHRSAYCGEYVPGPCTHRPSHHES